MSKMILAMVAFSMAAFAQEVAYNNEEAEDLVLFEDEALTEGECEELADSSEVVYLDDEEEAAE